jgi:hypothetical protein
LKGISTVLKKFISTTLICLPLSTAGSAAGLLPEVLAGTVRSASRFMRTVPHYLPPAAPVGFAHSRLMSSLPIVPLEARVSISKKPKAIFAEPDTAASTPAAPEKLLELPDALYKGNKSNTAKILKYVKDNNLEKEFEELVLNNCIGDLQLIAKIHQDNVPLSYCVIKIQELSSFLRANHPYRIMWDHLDDIEGTLLDQFMKLGYLTPKGKLESQIKELSDEKFRRAFENILSYISKKRDEMR